MATVILLRHGRTTANASGVLAGRLPGVHLDSVGRAQATLVSERLEDLTLSEVVSSPMARCRETTRLALGERAAPAVRIEAGLAECDYGTWQGRPLKELATEPLWATVQRQPSHAVFPEGESLRGMAHRAVDAVRRIDAEVTASAGSGAVWLAVSHGDIIKSVLADALGMHLDTFQRLAIDPASVSVVRYGEQRPHVVCINSHAGSLGWLQPPQESGAAQEPSAANGSHEVPDPDETVGGGAGPQPLVPGA